MILNSRIGKDTHNFIGLILFFFWLFFLFNRITKYNKSRINTRRKCVLLYKKYGVVCWDGITRSVSGTALKMMQSRSLDDLKLRIDATFPQR